MKQGVPTSTVLRAKTAKQKSDQNARQKANRLARQRNKRVANTLYGALTYKCSNGECFNTIRVHEEMGERRILCSRCNNGFFTQLKKDDRNHLARKEDFKKGKKK